MPSDTQSVACPHCRGEVHYVAALAGQNVGCPICDKDFRMPTVNDPGFVMPESTSEPAPRIVSRPISRGRYTADHITAYEAYHRGFWGGLGIWTAMMVLSVVIGLLTFACAVALGLILTAAGR